MTQPLQPAELDWHDGQPYARHFDDVYFSPRDGLAETEYVFLQHNGLPLRWQQHALTHFVIAELGFGTGLNFLATWAAWQQHAPATRHLHYISIEKHPLRLNDLQHALARWACLQPLLQQFTPQYPPLIHGYHRLQFERVTLTLIFDDVSEALPNIDSPATGLVDAWFLDGFAPAKNPLMWNEPIWQALARLSRQNATLSTFTSASAVRRGLQQVGFTVQKARGFGTKREMLYGTWTGNTVRPTSPVAPWWRYPSVTTQTKQAIIIGGGLAGSATAQALAQRGWYCTLLEQQAALAQGGSGNRQGVVYPLLAANFNAVANQFYRVAYPYAWQRIQAVAEQVPHARCGVLQLARDEQDANRLQRIAAHFPTDYVTYLDKSAQQTSAFNLGVELAQAGLFFPQAGWVSPIALCHAWAQHANIEVKLSQQVVKIRFVAHQWQIYNSNNQIIATAPVVIFCNAYGLQALPQGRGLPLQALRGQVSYPAVTQESTRLRSVLCYEGYLTPCHNEHHSLGATYEINCNQPQIRATDNLANISALAPHLPEVAHAFQSQLSQLAARSSVRCSSLDHLPLIGALADREAFQTTYHDLSVGKRWLHYPDFQPQPGLWVNVAHSSRGLVSIPLGAELLASWLNQEPLPLPQSVLTALQPQRFWVRALKKRIAI